MELSQSAQEVLIQAQMLKLESNGTMLSQEHIMYGLLRMADDPQGLGSNVSQDEAHALWRFLMTKIISIRKTQTALRIYVMDKRKNLLTDCRQTIDRALEMAGDHPITPMDLAKAVFEKPSVALRILCDMEKPKETAAKEPKGTLADEAKPQINQPKQEKPPQPEKKQLGLEELLRMAQEMERNTPAPQHKPSVRKRTKMGLLTYRGGVVVAAIQYFLLGLLIPAAMLFGVEHFTGYVSAPPTPLITFCLHAFVLLCGCHLVRGVFMLVGLASKSFALFLRLLCDLGLIGALAVSFRTIFAYPACPLWLRIVVYVLGILVLVIGRAAFDALDYTPAQRKKQIRLDRYGGRVGQVMFRGITQQMVWIALVTAVMLELGDRMNVWIVRVLLITGLTAVWNIPNVILSCVHLWLDASWHKGGGKGFFLFLRVMYVGTCVPLLLLVLHQMFHWGALRTWELIVMGVYALSVFISAILSAKD